MLFRSHLNEIAVRKRLILMECETKRWILKVQWDQFTGRFKKPGGPSLSVWGQWAHWFTVAAGIGAGLWGRKRGKDVSSGASSPDDKRWYWMPRLMESLLFFVRR